MLPTPHEIVDYLPALHVRVREGMSAPSLVREVGCMYLDGSVGNMGLSIRRMHKGWLAADETLFRVQCHQVCHVPAEEVRPCLVQQAECNKE